MGALSIIFQGIYELFNFLYSEGVWNYASGELEDTSDIISNFVGPITFAIVLVIAVLFYFITRSSFNGWKSWLIVMCITSVLAWIVGFTTLYNSEDFENEDTEYVSSYEESSDSDSEEGTSSVIDFVGFAFSNMLISILEFLILSIILKRFSKSCRHTPWRSLGYVYKGR